MEEMIRPLILAKDNNNNNSSSNNSNTPTATGTTVHGSTSSGHLMNFHMAFIKTSPPAPPPVVLPLTAHLLPMVSNTPVAENSINTNTHCSSDIDTKFKINTLTNTKNNTLSILSTNNDNKNNINIINTSVNNNKNSFINSGLSNNNNNVRSSTGNTTHTVNNGMYQCGMCLRIFPLPSSLKAHMKTHVEFFLYKCDICNLQFKWKTAYDNHVKKHTIAEEGGLPKTEIESPRKEGTGMSTSSLPRKAVFQCELCGKVFGYKCNLELHGAVHSDEKNFVCGTCGRGFKLKMHLDTHMKVHDDFREFKCKICDKQFKLKGNLKTHIKSIHFQERPWPCEVCEKSFKLKQHLLTHMRLKHSTPTGSGPMLTPSATPTLDETSTDPLSLVGPELAREVSSM